MGEGFWACCFAEVIGLLDFFLPAAVGWLFLMFWRFLAFLVVWL